MPCSAAASRSWAQARSAQPNLLLRKKSHSAVSRTTVVDDDVEPLIGEHHAVGEHDLALRRRRHVLHLHAEAEHRDGLQDQEESDRGDQPAERIVAQRPEQAIFHEKAEQADKDETDGDGDEEVDAHAGIKRDHGIGAGHVELAMGEVDDAHHAEDEHEANGDERHVARGVGRVHHGLKEQLKRHPNAPRYAGPAIKDGGAGNRGQAHLRWKYI